MPRPRRRRMSLLRAGAHHANMQRVLALACVHAVALCAVTGHAAGTAGGAGSAAPADSTGASTCAADSDGTPPAPSGLWPHCARSLPTLQWGSRPDLLRECVRISCRRASIVARRAPEHANFVFDGGAACFS